jgi:hypothetical protein
LATLSRISGVSYTTLRRFSQCEGHPTAEPVLKIVDATLGGAAKIEFVNKHFPEIARTIDRFNKQTQPIEEPAREELRLFYMRDPHNLILNLAITAKGTSVDAIRRLCGERGLEALDEMVECEVLERDLATGAVRYREDTLVTTDCDVILNFIKRSVDYFDRSLIGTRAAKVSHMTASISEEGLRRIHDLVSETISRIHEIKHDRRYAGDIPFFVDVMMNVYDKKPLHEAKSPHEDEHHA